MSSEFGNTLSHKTASGTLSADVADAGTFTVSYPNRGAPESGVTNSGDFYNTFYHRLVMNGAVMVYPDDFTLTFGTSSITVTNRSGATWPSGAPYVVQIDEPGKKVWGADVNNKSQMMARQARSDVILVSLGAPDILDADGVCVSQSIAAGTASTSTSATLDGALASTNAQTGLREVVLDVPRNVVAAWTTSAVLTVEGYDEYGKFMIEKSASGTSLTGKKAFKKITRVWSSVAITSASVGTGDVLGLPFFLPGRQNILTEIIDGNLSGDRQAIRMPFQCNSTDLAAGTVQYFPSPVAGRIVRFSTAVQVTLGDSADDVGTVNLTVNGAAVTGSTLTTYTTATGGSGSVGDVASTTIPTTSDNAAVAVGDAIGVAPSSTWVSVGALNGVIEIAPTGSSIYNSGTFVVGMTTAAGSTATTNDVRGTYAPPVACDGSITFQLLVSLPSVGNRGADQFAG